LAVVVEHQTKVQQLLVVQVAEVLLAVQMLLIEILHRVQMVKVTVVVLVIHIQVELLVAVVAHHLLEQTVLHKEEMELEEMVALELHLL
jgi:hypothetical protein